MTTPKPEIRQFVPRPPAIPDRIPLQPKTAGPRRNGMPEMKPYVYCGSGTDDITGSMGRPLKAPSAEDYVCTECGARAKVGGTVRPDHKPACSIGKRVRELLAGRQS
jgi:hypothetical protein